MNFFINTSGPLAFIVLAILIGAIYFGKKMHKPILPALGLALSLILLVMTSIYAQNATDEALKATAFRALAVDFGFVLMSFFGYLWADEVSSKAKNKKSYNDSLSWFWEQL